MKAYILISLVPILLAQSALSYAEVIADSRRAESSAATRFVRSAESKTTFPYEGKWKRREVRCMTVDRRTLYVIQDDFGNHCSEELFSCNPEVLELMDGNYSRSEDMKGCKVTSSGTYEVLSKNKLKMTRKGATECGPHGDVLGIGEFTEMHFYLNENQCLEVDLGGNCGGDGFATEIYCPDLTS